VTFIGEGLTCGKGVLVHCRHGQSRSATVVAAYLIANKICGGVEEAMDFLKEKRPRVNPNDGFMEQLRKYEKAVERSSL